MNKEKILENDISILIICEDDFENVYNMIQSLQSIASEFIIVSLSERDGFSYGSDEVDITFLKSKNHSHLSTVYNKGILLCEKKWILKLNSNQYVDKQNKDRIKKAIVHGIENDVYAFEANKMIYVQDNWSCLDSLEVSFCKGYTKAIVKKDIVLFRNDDRIKYDYNMDDKIYYTIERESFSWLESNIVLHDWSLVVTKDFTMYLKTYEKRINENKDNPENYYDMGRIYEIMGDYQKASNVYKLAYDNFKDEKSLLYYVLSSKNIKRKEE